MEGNLEKLEVPAGELVPVIREILSSGQPFTLTVTGFSMRPTLNHMRDQVRMVSPSVRTVKKREIVFFQRKDGTFVLHRILHIEKDGCLLMNGDAQNWVETISSNQIIGVVDMLECNGRVISADSVCYRIWVAVWTKTRRFRPLIFRSVYVIGRIKKEIEGVFEK